MKLLDTFVAKVIEVSDYTEDDMFYLCNRVLALVGEVVAGPHSARACSNEDDDDQHRHQNWATRCGGLRSLRWWRLKIGGSRRRSQEWSGSLG